MVSDRRRQVICRQTVTLVLIKVTTANVSTVAQSTAGLDEGGRQVTVQKTGTGQYDFVFSSPGAGRFSKRAPVVMGIVPSATALQGRAPFAQLTKSGFRIIIENNAGAAADADFMASVAVLFDLTAV